MELALNDGHYSLRNQIRRYSSSPNLTWVATTNPARIMGGRFILADTKKYSQQIDFTDLNKKIKI